MLIQPTPTHHIIVSSISGIPVTSIYQGLQPTTTSSYYVEMLCHRQIVVLSSLDLRNAKHLFDAVCLSLGRDRFAISFCSSVMYNKIIETEHGPSAQRVFSSIKVIHTLYNLSFLKAALEVMGDLRSFEPGEGVFTCEFFDLRAASKAYADLKAVEGIIEIQPFFSHEVSQLMAEAVKETVNNRYTTSWGPCDTQLVTSGVNTNTTFMIKNIPNKYTQKLLLELLNTTHFGQFDFLYLRIDFRNRCNVGYAFINFVDVRAILDFILNYVGKLWPHFNSEKLCDLAYARVQGKLALVEKFKNSSVMEQDPSYRPKLFYTHGFYIGKEESFPSPSSSLTNSNH